MSILLPSDRMLETSLINLGTASIAELPIYIAWLFRGSSNARCTDKQIVSNILNIHFLSFLPKRTEQVFASPYAEAPEEAQRRTGHQSLHLWTSCSQMNPGNQSIFQIRHLYFETSHVVSNQIPTFPQEMQNQATRPSSYIFFFLPLKAKFRSAPCSSWPVSLVQESPTTKPNQRISASVWRSITFTWPKLNSTY